MPETPSLRMLPAGGRTRAVVLVLHGGRSRGDQPTTQWQLAYRRMVPIAHAVHRAARHDGVAVWLLRNRVRGWNEPRQDPVRDAEWALERIASVHPGASIILIGHSMGGRAALRVAGTDGVVGICALAPWLEPGEPVAQLAGRTVLIAHGDRDRATSPEHSYAYALRAREVTPDVGRFVIPGAGHPMLRRAADWTGLVRAFVTTTLGVTPPDATIMTGLRAPAPDGLRSPLPAGVW